MAQSTSYSYNAPQKGEAYLIADKVNIRKSASSDAAIVATVPIATKLTILEISTATLTLRNISAPWYKVQFQDGKQAKTGFVWSGFIANIAHYDKAAQLWFLQAPSAFTLSKDRPEITTQIRVARNHQQLDLVNIPQYASEISYFGMQVHGNKGVEPVKNIVESTFNEDMCGGSNGFHTLFWDGKKLHYIDALYSGVDVPAFGEEYFIYPDDKNGEKGFVKKRMIEGEMSEDDNEKDIIHSDKTEVYVWYKNKLRMLKD